MSNVAAGSAAVAAGLGAALLGLAVTGMGLAGRLRFWMRYARQLTFMMAAAAALAVIVMERALITRDFTVKFVAENGSSTTPPVFNVATLWSALEGSILLWALVLCGYAVAVAIKFRGLQPVALWAGDSGDRQRVVKVRGRGPDDPMLAWAMLVMFAVSAFFFALMVGPADPFIAVEVPPGYDGPGPNPLLQNHILMAFHPPILYLGYVGFTVPFAFAVAALATGRLGEGWLAATRRWTVAAWGFLTFGIVLGAWWSYETLGWGGYWAWDPVENASFLPWLTGTAYLHSVMVQERRGMLRVWNLSLVIATFSLTILGTFLTRSGVLASVHSFTESGIGPALLGFFAVIVAVSLALIAWRGDQLRTPGRIAAPMSREGAFLANNALFAAFAVRGAARHRVPAAGGGLRRAHHLGGQPLLRPDDPARRLRAAVPDGGGAHAALGRIVAAPADGAAEPSPAGAHVDCGRGAGAGGGRRGPGMGGAAGVRPGRLRGRGRAAPDLPGRAPSAVARPGGPDQRRHGRALGRGPGRGGIRGQPSPMSARPSSIWRPARPATFAGHEIVYVGSAVVVHENRTERVAFVRVDDAKTYGPAIATYPFASPDDRDPLGALHAARRHRAVGADLR